MKGNGGGASGARGCEGDKGEPLEGSWGDNEEGNDEKGAWGYEGEEEGLQQMGGGKRELYSGVGGMGCFCWPQQLLQQRVHLPRQLGLPWGESQSSRPCENERNDTSGQAESCSAYHKLQNNTWQPQIHY